LNELVSNRLCDKLRSTTVSQKLLFKNLIYLVCEFNGNLDVNILFRHVYPLVGNSTANLMRIMDNLWCIGASLEPEVHIVDRYMQLVKKCFTMTNIMLEGGKEIDLLAFNPISNEKYHVEVRVATGRGFRLRLVDTQTKSGRKHRRGLDTLNEIKFAHPTVINAVKEIFGGGEYRKVLVVWDVEDSGVIEQAKSHYSIEVWKMADLMNQLMQKVKTKPYRNDVLRAIQLISKRGNIVF
jgi:hypothetical protein